MYFVNKSLNLKKDLVSSEFSKNGYLVIENFIDQIVCNKIIEDIDYFITKYQKNIQC